MYASSQSSYVSEFRPIDTIAAVHLRATRTIPLWIVQIATLQCGASNPSNVRIANVLGRTHKHIVNTMVCVTHLGAERLHQSLPPYEAKPNLRIRRNWASIQTSMQVTKPHAETITPIWQVTANTLMIENVQATGPSFKCVTKNNL